MLRTLADRMLRAPIKFKAPTAASLRNSSFLSSGTRRCKSSMLVKGSRSARPHNRATGFFPQTFHAKQAETKSSGQWSVVGGQCASHQILRALRPCVSAVLLT